MLHPVQIAMGAIFARVIPPMVTSGPAEVVSAVGTAVTGEGHVAVETVLSTSSGTAAPTPALDY